MEVPLARWTNATRQILVLGRQAPRKFSHPAKNLFFSLFLLIRTVSFVSSFIFYLAHPSLFSFISSLSAAIRCFADSRKGERTRASMEGVGLSEKF